MRAYTRSCVTAGLVLAGLVPAALAAAPAAAAGPVAATGAVVAAADGCARGTDDYGAELPCEVDLTVLTPVCDGDVPRLRYSVTPVGSDRSTVTIAFVNPDGDDVVHADQPLSGSIPWPGAVVDAAGAGVDWPGWRLEGGAWVVGDEYDWVRPAVEVRFEAERTASAVVAYPPSSPVCLTEPERSEVLVAAPVAAAPAAGAPAEVLSETGSSAGPIALISGGLLLAGTGGVLAARRRRV